MILQHHVLVVRLGSHFLKLLPRGSLRHGLLTSLLETASVFLSSGLLLLFERSNSRISLTFSIHASLGRKAVSLGNVDGLKFLLTYSRHPQHLLQFTQYCDWVCAVDVGRLLVLPEFVIAFASVGTEGTCVAWLGCGVARRSAVARLARARLRHTFLHCIFLRWRVVSCDMVCCFFWRLGRGYGGSGEIRRLLDACLLRLCSGSLELKNYGLYWRTTSLTLACSALLPPWSPSWSLNADVFWFP